MYRDGRMSPSKSFAMPMVLISALLVIAVLFCAYATMRYSAIVDATERENLAFTNRIAAELAADIDTYVQTFKTSSPESIRRAPETAAFRSRLRRFSREGNVLKVKIYALSGIAVFSSDASQIGGSVSNGVDFNAIARQDNQFSRLSFRDKIAGFDRMAFNRYVVSSYTPVFGSGGRTLAVLEIYADVTAQAQNAARVKWATYLVMLLALVIVGIATLPRVRRAGRMTVPKTLVRPTPT